jgi:DNA polymerase III gamma/tau subunit
MDKQSIPHYQLTSLHPAQLWIGQHNVLIQEVILLLQTIFCAKKGCMQCATCKNIQEKQHHAIKWYYPEKQYTLESIQDILNTIAFKLNHSQYFFFVIQKADFLTPACANQLLKSIEEPPAGYHFFLLAERKEQLLPTIRSRCIIRLFSDTRATDLHSDLFTYFTSTLTNSPAAFLATLDQAGINERETIELLDALLIYWTTEYTSAIQQNQDKKMVKAKKKLAILTLVIQKPPMPGSSKLFLKNLFLQFWQIR